MLSHFAEANISQSHMAQEMQSWEQQGSLKGLTSQFHGAGELEYMNVTMSMSV